MGTGLLVWGQVASEAQVYLSGEGCSKMPRAHGVSLMILLCVLKPGQSLRGLWSTCQLVGLKGRV